MTEKTKSLERYLLRILFSLLLFFLGSLLADLLVGYWKGNEEEVGRVAYPPHFHEVKRTVEYQFEFRANSLGLRYPELKIPKPREVFRVLVVGDSYTVGEGVEEGERFTALLEQNFSTTGKKVEFVNGGLTGAGPLEYARLFFWLRSRLEPEALLICLFANDIQNTSPFFTPAMIYEPQRPPVGWRKFPAFLWPNLSSAVFSLLDQRQRWKQTATNDLVGLVSAEARREGIPEEEIVAWQKRLPADLVAAVNRGELNGNGLAYGLLNPWYWADSIELNSPIAEEKFQAMLGLLAEMVKLCREEKRMVALVYIPSPFQYDPSVWDPRTLNPWRVSGVKLDQRWLTHTTPVQLRLEKWAASQALPFLDLTPALREAIKSESKLTYPLDGHFTKAGHQVVAVAIAEWLRTNRVFPLP